MTTGFVIVNNLTNDDFSVTKAEVIYDDGETRAELTAIIRYKKEGNYLISLRSRAGIEAARILISSDTLMANDRINRKLYYGSAEALEKKYGISVKALPLIFGDLVQDNNENGTEIKCNNGEGMFTGKLNGEKVTYTIDCNYSKTKRTEIPGNGGELSMNIEYRDFRNYERRIYPANVIIRVSKEKSEIVISLKKMDFNKVENLNFIPGEDYERILLK